MPTLALHSQYWAGAGSTPPPELGASDAGGFVPWQIAILQHNGFAMGSIVWAWALIEPVVTHGLTGVGT